MAFCIVPMRCNGRNACRVLQERPDIEHNTRLGGKTVIDNGNSSESAPSQDTGHGPKRKVRPASEVGVTLTVSKEALKEIDRMQQEMSEAVRVAHKYAWR